MAFDPNNKRMFGTTLDYMMTIPRFAARARVIKVPLFRPLVSYSLSDQLRLFVRVLRAATREDTLLLLSSRGALKPELLAILVIGLWPKRFRPTIILNGPMYERTPGWRSWIEPIIVKLADRAVTRYAVQSSEELEVFPRTWGLDASKTRFVPYLFTLSEQDLALELPPPGDYIFAGGNSFRDYDALLATARLLPDRQFILATKRLDGRTDLPPNVIAKSVPHPEFIKLMAGAAAAVVPMQRNLHRSTGHQTYLNAMWFRRPTIVNDVLGVRDHVKDGVTGIIVDGSPASYAQALNWIFDPAHHEAVQTMCNAAHQEVSTHFSRESHARYLLAVVDDAVDSTQHTNVLEVAQNHAGSHSRS